MTLSFSHRLPSTNVPKSSLLIPVPSHIWVGSLRNTNLIFSFISFVKTGKVKTILVDVEAGTFVVTDPNPNKFFGSNEDVPNDIDVGDLVTDDVVEAAPNEKLGGCGLFVTSEALNVKVGDTFAVLSFSLSLPKLKCQDFKN